MLPVNNIKKGNNKPVLEDVIISQQKLAEFNSELKSSSASDKNKRGIIKKYLGGTCTYCGEIPTKILKYDLEGDGKLVEWYCDSCFERWGGTLVQPSEGWKVFIKLRCGIYVHRSAIFALSTVLLVPFLYYATFSISDACAAPPKPELTKTCFYNNKDYIESTKATCCWDVATKDDVLTYCEFCTKIAGTNKWECDKPVQQAFETGALDLPEGLDVKPTPPSEPKRPGGDTGLEPESLAPSNDTSNDTKVPKDLGGLNGNGPTINPGEE